MQTAKSCKKGNLHGRVYVVVYQFYVHKWLKKQIARYESRDCCNNLYSENLPRPTQGDYDLTWYDLVILFKVF